MAKSTSPDVIFGDDWHNKMVARKITIAVYTAQADEQINETFYSLHLPPLHSPYAVARTHKLKKLCKRRYSTGNIPL